MKVQKLREDNATNSAIEVMLHNDQFQDEPYVGSFWYDIENNSLFGVEKTPADEATSYFSSQFKSNVRTGRALHKNIWQKNFFRGKDDRFKGDYTKVPRGRVFLFDDKEFRVYTGSWIYSFPEAKEEILYEFQLPETTKFVVDIHWDLGRGWSDEF